MSPSLALLIWACTSAYAAPFGSELPLSAQPQPPPEPSRPSDVNSRGRLMQVAVLAVGERWGPTVIVGRRGRAIGEQWGSTVIVGRSGGAENEVRGTVVCTSAAAPEAPVSPQNLPQFR